MGGLEVGNSHIREDIENICIFRSMRFILPDRDSNNPDGCRCVWWLLVLSHSLWKANREEIGLWISNARENGVESLQNLRQRWNQKQWNTEDSEEKPIS